MDGRIVRIANEMKKVISDILMYELKDPRIPQMTSVTKVDLTKDLKYAKVYVSVYGSEAEKASCMLALKKSAGYIRREIGKRMIIRILPELNFKLDESIEYGAYISELINKVVPREESDDGGSDE
ncbi:MAG: 30S ribosome-binding factor RbfA [Clostridiaceae bacterium]|jgi:ribosome-binding factor A|nr:30S ribosome-binding factor RbfA [Clostridiaceae bacterium]